MNTQEASRVVPIRRQSVEELASLFEAVLFASGRPMPVDQLARVAGIETTYARRVLEVLRSHGDSRGICVSVNGSLVELVINPQFTGAIQGVARTDLERSLSLIEEYLSVQRQRGRRPKTIESYRLFLSRYARAVGKPIDEVETRDIRQFLMAEERRGNQNSTIASKIHRLSSLYKWLVREEIIDKNPMLRIDAPEEEEPEPKHLTHEELELVRMACVKPIERLLVEVLYSSGIRREEASKLDWPDVDFADRTLTVRDGKGGKFRVVPLSTRATILLRQHRNVRTDNDPCVFRSQFKRRMAVETIGRRIRIIGERAGLEERLTPHRLRHSLATHLLEAGVPLDVVQKILGHKKPSTTQIYAKRQMRQVEEYYRRVIQ